MIKDNERGRNQTTMNEKGGACTSSAESCIPLYASILLFKKKQNKICKV
jgi:hypothetical protein